MNLKKDSFSDILRCLPLFLSFSCFQSFHSHYCLIVRSDMKCEASDTCSITNEKVMIRKEVEDARDK